MLENGEGQHRPFSYMTDHQTLATWSHDGAAYSVSVVLEDDMPTEVIIEEVIGQQTRCATVPANPWTLEELQDGWTTDKRQDVMSHRAKKALDMAWEM